MQRTHRGPSRSRQWGRAGPIMALVSILVIAALAKVTLAEFGLTAPKEPAAKAASKGVAAVAAEVDDDDDAVAAAPAPKSNAKPPQSPANSIDKAHAVQGVVNGQAARTASQIESEGK